MTQIAEEVTGVERTREDFAVVRGEQITIRFTAHSIDSDIDDLASRTDLTSATARFSLKANLLAVSTEISKASPTGITILPQGATDPTRGQFDVLLTTAETDALSVGRHVYSARIDGAAPAEQTLATGHLTILQKVE